MTAYTISCAVIPEREDDASTAKFLVVAPEDRIVWIAKSEPNRTPDLSPEGRKRAVTQAELISLMAKLRRQETEGDGDILQLTDRQIDCRDRNLGSCNRYPHTTSCASSCDCPEGATESGDDEDLCPGVLECWMLEDEVD